MTEIKSNSKNCTQWIMKQKLMVWLVNPDQNSRSHCLNNNCGYFASLEIVLAKCVLCTQLEQPIHSQSMRKMRTTLKVQINTSFWLDTMCCWNMLRFACTRGGSRFQWFLMLLDVNCCSRPNSVPIYLPIRSKHKGSIVQPCFLQWIRNKDQVAFWVSGAGNPLMWSWHYSGKRGREIFI